MTRQRSLSSRRHGPFLIGGLACLLAIFLIVIRGPAEAPTAAPGPRKLAAAATPGELIPVNDLLRSQPRVSASDLPIAPAAKSLRDRTLRPSIDPSQPLLPLEEIVQVCSDPPEYAQERDLGVVLVTQVNEDLRWVLILRSPGEQAALDRNPWPPPVVRVLTRPMDPLDAEVHSFLTCVPVGEPRAVGEGSWADWRSTRKSTPPGEPSYADRPRALSPSEIAEAGGFDLEYSYSIVVGPTEGYESERYEYYGPEEYYGDLEILWRGERTTRTLDILPPIRCSTDFWHIGGTAGGRKEMIRGDMDLRFRTTIDRFSFDLRHNGTAVGAQVLERNEMEPPWAGTRLEDGHSYHVFLRPAYWPPEDFTLEISVTLDDGRVLSCSDSMPPEDRLECERHGDL